MSAHSDIGHVEGMDMDDDDMDDISILADDAQRGLPPTWACLALQGEERLHDNLPTQIVVPSRRRAHTIDVEFGRRSCSDDEETDMLVLDRTRLHSKCSDPAPDDVSLCSFEVDQEDDAQRRRTNAHVSLEERQRRRRQKLFNSRCMRGLALFCVCGMLVLQPSTTRLISNAVPKQAEYQIAPPLSSTSSTETNSDRRTQEETALRMKMAALPKFHYSPQHRQSAVVPPPTLANSRTNGTIVRWHKLPPDPPTIYHKKQRPILSLAHSFQHHQEPLIFGKEQENSFEDKEEIPWMKMPWMNALIWMSLICLLLDTACREFQRYRFNRQYALNVRPPQTLSTLQRRGQRSSLRQRHLCPEPGRRRFDSF